MLDRDSMVTTAWFGIIVGTELALAGARAAALAMTGDEQWVAWWVGPIMGGTFVVFALVNGALVVRHLAPAGRRAGVTP